jgi:hypothetical protein
MVSPPFPSLCIQSVWYPWYQTSLVKEISAELLCSSYYEDSQQARKSSEPSKPCPSTYSTNLEVEALWKLKPELWSTFHRESQVADRPTMWPAGQGSSCNSLGPAKYSFPMQWEVFLWSFPMSGPTCRPIDHPLSPIGLRFGPLPLLAF